MSLATLSQRALRLAVTSGRRIRARICQPGHNRSGPRRAGAWRTFGALLSRDGRVARRNLVFTLVQNLFQPLLLAFVFGRILPAGGLMRAAYKEILLPGTVCVAMVMSGVWGVAMPLIQEFGFTWEIEDRLLAPIAIGWLAAEKVVVGMAHALAAGLVAFPAAWMAIGPGVAIGIRQPIELAAACLLVALLAGVAGLVLGCSVGQMQIGLVITLVVAPLIAFGCAYYPWQSLHAVPGLDFAVLINPLVFANEALRGALAPDVPHIDSRIALAVLASMDLALLGIGLKRFHDKALG